MPGLFDPFTLRGVMFRNRVGVSPMCQYSAVDGVANVWHLVHLASRAVGGAGMVMAEATAVLPEGRISPGDTGLWNDEQVSAWRPITAMIGRHGAVPAIQLAHAGRKASTPRPWETGSRAPIEQGGWQPLGPTDQPFAAQSPLPRAMTRDDIRHVRDAFVAAAGRAIEAGFRAIEVHAAHGYLLHSFYSPLSNTRTDDYGHTFDGRVRLVVETTAAVRQAIPQQTPLIVRLSCSDWTNGGWSIDDSVELSRRLKAVGADLIDCSSGGAVPVADVPAAPGYQVPFATAIRRGAQVPTAAVGMIDQPEQAQAIVQKEEADMVLIGRAFLRDAYWPIHAARALGIDVKPLRPVQYARAID